MSAPPDPSPRGRRLSQGSVIVGLGANEGASREALRGAVQALLRRYPPLVVSPLYVSAPLGPPQQDFLNAAVCLHHPGDLSDLLRELQALEKAAGRVRRERWGPRTLDLDILWAHGRTEGTSSLTVPHPELHQRAFALLPLLDVFPSSAPSEERRSLERSLQSLSDQHVTKADETDWWAPVCSFVET